MESGIHVMGQRSEAREGNREYTGWSGRDTLTRMVRESLLDKETIKERLMQVGNWSGDPLQGEPAGWEEAVWSWFRFSVVKKQQRDHCGCNHLTEGGAGRGRNWRFGEKLNHAQSCRIEADL